MFVKYFVSYIRCDSNTISLCHGIAVISSAKRFHVLLEKGRFIFLNHFLTKKIHHEQEFCNKLGPGYLHIVHAVFKGDVTPSGYQRKIILLLTKSICLDPLTSKLAKRSVFKQYRTGNALCVELLIQESQSWSPKSFPGYSHPGIWIFQTQCNRSFNIVLLTHTLKRIYCALTYKYIYQNLVNATKARTKAETALNIHNGILPVAMRFEQLIDIFGFGAFGLVLNQTCGRLLNYTNCQFSQLFQSLPNTSTTSYAM
ncbi:uncharacterized protein EV154DRAFT_590563 [Mucor mucedo]|uniref:uncharacterized protein n=1 Tax=Mucor mucedo TaxID=29922 RepID=UPI002220DFFF|nr:uncharacterized protein EV154DRAFT_590563 [Mucor mucedo]KAI7890227.1 hypothetical protein EV154DRAFT_590563 [Mucor mucedo]